MLHKYKTFKLKSGGVFSCLGMFPQGGDFKNKQATKQLFEQEYNCSNFLDFKIFV